MFSNGRSPEELSVKTLLVILIVGVITCGLVITFCLL